jgi:hypothetical protein
MASPFIIRDRRVHPRLLPPAEPQGDVETRSSAVYALGVYTEFPVDLVTDVHFKQKPDDGGSPSWDFTGYCSPGYGFGASGTVYWNESLGNSVPYGPNQYAPFVGTFPTSKLSQSADGKTIYGSLLVPPVPDPGTITATPYGNHALSVQLDPLSLRFITTQLMDFVPLGQVEWLVPMAMGVDHAGIPINVLKYQIDMTWSAATGINVAYEYGIGVHYPLPDGGVSPLPDEPTVSFGIGASSGTYIWEVPYGDPDPNKYKPILGWMRRGWDDIGSGGWVGDDAFMVNTLQHPAANFYTWKVTPTCVARLP